MILPRGIALSVALLSVWAPGRAGADALYDYLGPREIAVGESARADARGALATTLNPAGVALGRELVFETSFGHRVEDGANLIAASACDSTVAVPGCYYYRYFSVSPEAEGDGGSRRVHEGGVAFGRALTPQVVVGATGKYFDYNSNLTGEEDAAGFTFDVGAVVRPLDMIGVALVGHHLLGADSPQYPRALAAGLAIRPLPALALAVDGLWRLERPEGQSTGRYGGGAEYFISSSDGQAGYPVRAGVVHDVADDTTYLTAGLGLTTTKLGVDLGARTALGGTDALIVSVSLRLFGPRQIAGTTRYR